MTNKLVQDIANTYSVVYILFPLSGYNLSATYCTIINRVTFTVTLSYVISARNCTKRFLRTSRARGSHLTVSSRLCPNKENLAFIYKHQLSSLIELCY